MAFEGEGAKASLFSSFHDTPSQHRPEGTGVEADHAVKAWPHYLGFMLGQPPLFWDL